MSLSNNKTQKTHTGKLKQRHTDKHQKLNKENADIKVLEMGRFPIGTSAQLPPPPPPTNRYNRLQTKMRQAHNKMQILYRHNLIYYFAS